MNLTDEEKKKLLQESLLQKYRAASDDSGLKAAQDQQSSAKNISLIGEALSGFATAHGKARGYESDNSFWNKLGSRYDGNVEAARQGIADKQKQFLTEDNLGRLGVERDRADTEFGQKQAEYSRTKKILDAQDDPNSFESQTARQLASEMFPNGKLDNMTASQFKGLGPLIQGLYETKSKKAATEAEAKRREFEYNRNKQDELAKENRAEARKIEGEKRAASGGKKMGTEEMARYDNVTMALQATEDMSNALAAGDNTFSIIGENNYTEARNRFKEAFGRMQSGGAIGKEEAAEFIALTPKATDNAEMQQTKLNKMRNILSSRLQSLGRPSAAAGGSGPQIFGAGSIPDAD